LSTRDDDFLEAACRTAEGVVAAFEPDGRLADRLT
jgi:hypothetical protein